MGLFQIVANEEGTTWQFWISDLDHFSGKTYQQQVALGQVGLQAAQFRAGFAGFS